MSEKPVGAGIAVGSYSSAEVEELRLQYRDEALKAVEAARQRALAEAKEHYQDTIRLNQVLHILNFNLIMLLSLL
jgi:hypothetical protein